MIKGGSCSEGIPKRELLIAPGRVCELGLVWFASRSVDERYPSKYHQLPGTNEQVDPNTTLRLPQLIGTYK